MTRHVSDDTLLKLALGLLDAQPEERARHHLEECARCRGLMQGVDRTLQHIKDVTPEVPADIPLLPSLGHNRFQWLRVAAMLAVGFGLGFFASESLRSPSVNVVRQEMVPSPPEWQPAGFVACDEIDLSVGLR